MVRRIGESLTETIGSKGNKLCLGVDKVHLLWTLRLRTKTWESALAWFGGILLWLNAVKNALSFSLVVYAGIVAPTV